MLKKLTMLTGVFFTALTVIMITSCSNSSSKKSSTAVNDGVAPAEVTSLAAAKDSGQVTLTWTEPADEDFSGVSISFLPLVSGVTQPISVSKGTTTYTVKGLTNGTEYTFWVKSLDSFGNASNGTFTYTVPAAPDTTAPGPVSSLFATVYGSSIILSWLNPADTDLATMKITYSGAASGSVTMSTGSTTVLTGMVNGTYTLSVSAVDDSGNASTPVSTTATVSVAALTTYFSDDFESETLGSATASNWDFLNGDSSAVWAIADDSGNKVLQYTAGGVSAINLIARVKTAAWATAVTSAGGTLDNYYVEARIKPMANSTTGNKGLHLVGRYQNDTSYLFGGLNVQPSNTSTQVELGYFNASTAPTRLSQVKSPIDIGTWYTVRVYFNGTTMKSYLDGVYMGTATDTNSFNSGRIGLCTYNKSFQIDNVKVGLVTDYPASISISATKSTSWSTLAGEAANVVTVAALSASGSTDTFTAYSSNPAAVTVSGSTSPVTLTPVGKGTATIYFVSSAGCVAKVSATIGAAFSSGSTSYTLSGKTSPVVSEAAAYPEGKLTLTFDSTPRIGSNGMIRIYKSSDDTLVDEIKTSSEINWLGKNSVSQFRGINTTLIKQSGLKIEITPHDGALSYGTKYYVSATNGTFIGTIGGIPFDGLSKTADWSFSTKVQPSSTLTTVTVAANDTTADFCYVQAALNHFMKNQTAGGTIKIAAGTYEEALFLRGVSNLNIVGASRDTTVIQYNNYELLNSGAGKSETAVSTSPSGGRTLFLVEDSDLLFLNKLTLKNLRTRTGSGDQAETIYANSSATSKKLSHRLVAEDAHFYSEQDTLCLNAICWFYNCLIEGNVDFIWGYSPVSLFENCEIRTIGDSKYSTTGSSAGGYIVHARCPVASNKGYVFLNCSLTSGAGPLGVTVNDNSTFLARSPGLTTSYDCVAYINCKMGSHITATGWATAATTADTGSVQPNPNPNPATATTGWKEYGSMNASGGTLDLSGRSPIAYQLTSGGYAGSYDSRDNILSYYGTSGWSPTPLVK